MPSSGSAARATDMKLTLMILIAVTTALPAGAQVSSPPRKPPVVSRPVVKPGGPGAPEQDTSHARAWRPYRFALFSSQVYDSNIERDRLDPITSYGFVIGGVARYQSAEVRPDMSVVYEIAHHSYTRNEQFDRVSHNLSAVASRRLTRSLTAEAIAEAALKGSSEDRDVGDQYIFIPRLNYRLDQARRLRVYGAYRIRRYDIDADRDAVNRYVGTELRSDVGDETRMELGFRYETNSAREARRSYTRRTYDITYTRTWGDNDQLLAEVRYRSQRYDQRPGDEDDDDPRHDHRVAPTLEWVHRFGRGFSTIANYTFENRTSNDPGNGYRDHVFALTGRFDW